MGTRSIFVAVPTYAGMAPDAPLVKMVQAWTNRMPVGFAPLANCAILGAARQELVTWFLNPRECFAKMCGDRVKDYAPHDLDGYDAIVWLDDDVTLEREGDIDRLIAMLDAGADVATAPVRSRHGDADVTFMAKRSGPSHVGTERVVELNATGFGLVAIRREVIERMVEAYGPRLTCRSQAFPGKKCVAMFDSFCAPPAALGVEDGDATPVHVHDDYSFSLRARRVGVQIFAAIDVPTLHRGIRCALGEEFDNRRKRA